METNKLRLNSLKLNCFESRVPMGAILVGIEITLTTQMESLDESTKEESSIGYAPRLMGG